MTPDNTLCGKNFPPYDIKMFKAIKLRRDFEGRQACFKSLPNVSKAIRSVSTFPKLEVPHVTDDKVY